VVRVTYVLVAAVLVALLGAVIAAWRPPGPRLTSALQHFAAGLVFAAAAAEVLPTILHDHTVAPVVIGGGAGVLTMVGLRMLGQRVKGPLGLVALIGVDILIDGLVLGLAFAAGEREALLLSIALVVEILFLGLAVTTAFDAAVPRWKAVAATGGIALLLPVGALLGHPAGALSPHVLSGLFAFALIALLYLVTEELLVEAHEVEDAPWTAAMFFVGFLLLIVLEEGLG
jgi:ZIP family zinc transporter